MLNFWLRSSVAITLVTVVLIVGFLINSAWPFIQQQGLSAVFSTEWYPYEHLYGLLPAIAGSISCLVIALLLAVPTAISAAIAIAELIPSPWNHLASQSIKLLAGIPSVVYGLMGLWLLLPWLQQSLNLLTGHSLVAAGLLLALMIIPTITVLSQEAIQRVPSQQKQTASHLGMNWNEILLNVVIPHAWPGIRSALLLALGRAVGETIAVMLVVGSIDRLPDPWYNLLQPAQTLTSRIGRELGEAEFGSQHFAALMACGLILASITISISLFSQRSINSTGQPH